MYKKMMLSVVCGLAVLSASAAFAVEIPVMAYVGDVTLQGTGNVLALANGTVKIKGIGNLAAKGFGALELLRGAEYRGKDGIWKKVEAPVFSLVLAGQGQILVKSNGTEVKAIGKGATWVAGQGTGTVLLSGCGIYKTQGLRVTDSASADIQ